MASNKTKVAGAGAIVLAASFIAPWEGLWTTAKIDTVGTGRPPTVCYGATRAEIPTLKVGDKYTPEQCMDLLEKSIPKYWDGIAPCIHVDLSDKTKAALISFAYNLGPGAICGSSISKKLNSGDQRGACEAMLSFNHAQGRVVKGLTNRRKAERALCLEGLEDPPKPQPQPAPTSWWASLLEKLKGSLFHVRAD